MAVEEYVWTHYPRYKLFRAVFGQQTKRVTCELLLMKQTNRNLIIGTGCLVIRVKVSKVPSIHNFYLPYLKTDQAINET